MSASAATQMGRAAAESLMVDACTITAAGADGGFDDTTGQYGTSTAGAASYAGKCRVQVPNVVERSANAGERDWTLQAAIISVPIVGSEGVKVGHKVTIDAATSDSALQGRIYTVVAEHHKTFATARRLRCEEVTA